MPTKIKTLVDTNVFIYAYDSGSIYHQKAVSLLNNTNLEFYSSSKNVSEFFAVLSKMGEPLAKVFSFYQSIQSNVKLLFPDANSLSIFEALLQKYQPKGNKVFDLEIVSIAINNQVSEISTVNVKDFSNISEIDVRPI